MTDTPQIDSGRAHTLLDALGEQLALREEQFTIAVVGGSTLLALGLVTRTTRDVDVVALLDGDVLVSAQPLSAALLEAAGVVAADFDLPADWLNAGPAQLSIRSTSSSTPSWTKGRGAISPTCRPLSRRKPSC
jgi:hypothetical protein